MKFLKNFWNFLIFILNTRINNGMLKITSIFLFCIFFSHNNTILIYSSFKMKYFIYLINMSYTRFYTRFISIDNFPKDIF